MCASSAEMLDCQGNWCGEDDAAEDAEDEEESRHHPSHVLMMSSHVAAT